MWERRDAYLRSKDNYTGRCAGSGDLEFGDQTAGPGGQSL